MDRIRDKNGLNYFFDITQIINNRSETCLKEQKYDNLINKNLKFPRPFIGVAN